MSIYDSLNLMQKEAVLCTEGPLLVLAGAGSGKTRVLTHRIVHLIEEQGVNPWNIMAITFTNKAAGEMRERVDQLVGFGAESIWVSTFHSSCVRILRRHIEQIGYTTNFTIYDGDDQRTLMKQVFKTLDVDPKLYKERTMLGYISSAKDELISPEQFELNAGGDFRQKKVAQIYLEYQNVLKKNNALDFDDLIVKTVELLQSNPEILDYYQERFKYIMVDEYQDTNTAQFKLISLLASKYGNLCVVGDDDQSIYKFRGANIENILNFERVFPGAKVIKLEQNYRSTQNILNAANEVISCNQGRKEKTLWTANEEGSLVRFKQFETANEEADGIMKEIKSKGMDYQDIAILYRTNAQSRVLEEKCLHHNLPYRMVGGVNFYQRREIKDILAYLKTIANGKDDLSVLRIINVPKRGIGATSISRVTMYASERGWNFYESLLRVQGVPSIGKAGDKILAFTGLIEGLKEKILVGEYSIQELIEELLVATGYQKELESEGEVEFETRMENIQELINKAISYTQEHENPTLEEFLEEVALVADVDRMDDSQSRITLMTLHSAKGLEFPMVYLAGMEDGLFPSVMSISSDEKDDVEEERRLCYVGITRARQELMLTAARQRMVNGETRYSKISRFLEEIPAHYLEQERLEVRSFGSGFGRSSAGSQNPWGKERIAGVSTFGVNTNAYAMKNASGSPSFGKAFMIEKAEGLDYGVGDRVSHMKFGEGTVVGIKDGAKDHEVTVSFDRVGVKKMFASFAKLKHL